MILFTFYFFASYWVYSGWKRKKIRDWSVFTFSDLVTFGLWILTCMEGTLLWAFLSSCSSPLPVSFQFFWLILLSLKKLRIRSPAKIKMSTFMTVICSSPLYSWILPPPKQKRKCQLFFQYLPYRWSFQFLENMKSQVQLALGYQHPDCPENYSFWYF